MKKWLLNKALALAVALIKNYLKDYSAKHLLKLDADKSNEFKLDHDFKILLRKEA